MQGSAGRKLAAVEYVPVVSADDKVVPAGVGDAPTVLSTSGGDNPATASTVGARPPGSGAPAPVGPTTLPIVPKDNYEIIGEHARGGLGRVLLARDRRLDRAVAIKVLASTSTTSLRRFQREAMVTAKLQHPAIVPVMEAGFFDTGEPFYAMKFVAGRPLKEVVEARTNVADRLALVPNVLVVAEAIAYAHAQGIIHRDLKPSNILVGDFGETVVVDWGLAKDLGAPGGSDDGVDEATPYRTAATPGLTTVGTVVGTPAYMPPEQAAGQPVDKRADVYALGAMLYHVLAGVSPYQGTTSDAIVASVLAGPPPPLAERAAGVPRELLAIAQKAMARDPRDRYADGKAFADDLARYQSGQLVQAFRYGRGRLVARWLRRHRLSVAVAAAVVVAGGTVGALSFRRITEERDRAEDARTRAEEAQRVAEARANELVFSQAQAVLPVDPTQTIAWLRKYDITAPDAFARAQVLAADAVSRGVARHVVRPGSLAQEAYLSKNGRWLFVRTREGLKVHDVERNATAETMAKQRPVPHLAYSPVTDVAALSDGTGRVRLFDGATGTATDMAPLDGDVKKMQFTPDGTRLLALVSNDFRVVDCRVRPWQCRETGLRLPVTNVNAAAIDLSNDGHLFTTYSPGESGTFADLDHDRLVSTPSLTPGNSAFAVTTQGAILTFGWADDQSVIHIADAPGSRPRELLRLSALSYGIFETDRLVFGDDAGKVHVLDPRGSAPRLDMRCGTDAITTLAATENTNIIAAGDRQGRVCVWNLTTGEAFSFSGHRKSVQHVSVSADGTTVISAGDDGDVRLWAVPATAQAMPIFPSMEKLGVIKAAWTDGPGRFVFGGEAGGIAVLVSRDAEPRLFLGHTRPVRSVQTSPDGTEVLSAAWDGTVRVWSMADGSSRTVLRHDGAIRAARYLDDGAAVVSIGEDKRVAFWRRADDTVRDIATTRGGILRLAVAGNAKGFAISTRAGEVVAWASADSPPRSLPGHTAAVLALAVAPDGDLVASGGEDKQVRISRVSDGGAVCALDVGATALDIAFTADGAGIFAGLSDGRVLHLDAACDVVATVLRTDSEARYVLVREGLLVVGSASSDLWLIDLASGSATTLRSEGELLALTTGPTGEGLVSSHGDLLLRFWRPDVRPHASSRKDFVHWLITLSSGDLDADILPTSAVDTASDIHKGLAQ
jgi:WD40 repeat protein